jgi:hypothetical protein
MHSTLTRSARRSAPLWMFTFGMAALASCVDPFAIDKKPTTQGSGGQPAGSGGSAGVAGAAGTGGLSGAGGVVGTGGAVVGTGGRAAVGGAPGAGGATPGTGGANVDGGSMDAPVVLPAPVQPAEPFATVNLCPPDPPIPDGGSLTCPSNLADIANWFPTTPAMQAGGGCKPLPHPAGECRFYTQSWQEFLIALQQDAAGKPAFLSWNTVENTFGAGAGQPTPAIPVLQAGVTQAGGRQIVIDQNGHALYYAMHLNPAFVKFVNDAHLTSADQIKRADPLIHFTTRAAIVETKEAWQIIPDTNPPQAATFITTRAMVPTLSVDPVLGVVEHDDQLRMVTVALIAIHIVHTIPDHPEFIWASFQHANRQTGVTDLAPSALALPPDTPLGDLTGIDNPAVNHLLYRANTLPSAANRGVFVPVLNAATQTFTTPPTNIYRVFAGGKSRDVAIDDDVAATNDALTTRFNVTNPRPLAIDRRPWYRLVGAIWQDVPLGTSLVLGTPGTFTVNRALVNDMTDPDIVLNGSDSANSITGGEDRISSLAMESFTQGEASFPSCFHCHDTQATNAAGVPQSRQPGSVALMKPGLINVSHIFNEVVRHNLN